MTGTPPLLTVCTPTFERPDLLRRALGSVVGQVATQACDVELIVSDNSTSDEPEQVARSLLAAWPGPTQYARNRPSVGMVENHNCCLRLATGRYVAFLHDDDYMLTGAVDAILRVVADPHAPAVNLFGVNVVRMDGGLRRRQVPRRDEVLSPAVALRRLLTASSYVRIPALVARADAYRAAGPFDLHAGNAEDFDMWVRLFARYGLHTIPHTIAGYTVHDAAQTTAMFTPSTVNALMQIFDRAIDQGVLTRDEVRRCQAAWFHQFILAAAYRHLEIRDRAGAAEVMRLFHLGAVRRLGPSVRWLPVRFAFGLLTSAPLRPPVARHQPPPGH